MNAITQSNSTLIFQNLKTTSLIVAEKFGKRHDHILRDIDNLPIPDSFRLPNFGERVREVSHGQGEDRKYKYYEMTRDGFSLLVMGFTGRKAMEWKIKFLQAFNAMEKQLTSPAAALPPVPKLTPSQMVEIQKQMLLRFPDGPRRAQAYIADFIVIMTDGAIGNIGDYGAEYFLTLDMGKECAMVERTKRGRKARQYFIECEKRSRQPAFEIPDNLPDALRLAAELGDRANRAEVALLEAQPKTDFFDKFCNADGIYGLQNAGRSLECRPNLFIRWLKSKYLFYQGGNLIPRAQYIQNGMFEVKTTILEDRTRLQAYITPKGLKKLAECLPDGIRFRKAA